MANGGKRPGAGRKPGAANLKTREIADKAAETGITPLEVMLDVMRQHYARKRFSEAAAIAKDCAPYIHPKLSAVEHSGELSAPVSPATIQINFVTPAPAEDE